MYDKFRHYLKENEMVITGLVLMGIAGVGSLIAVTAFYMLPH